jgi:DeoR family glycerol-3-phosphate regulon repressor
MPALLSRRQSLILEHVRARGTCRVSELARELRVSLETIRRDVKELVRSREVIKRHGTIALPQEAIEAPFERRLRENADAKRAIARRAAQLIDDGDSLMLDAGTTTSMFARELLRKRNLTIVTNSSDIARTLATVNGNRVYMAGGELNGDLGAAFGPSTLAFAASFRVKHAFVTASALNAVDGPMDYRLDEAEFARLVLSRGEQRNLLCDQSKFGRSALIAICAFDGIDRLITDAAPPSDLSGALSQSNVIIDVVAK